MDAWVLVRHSSLVLVPTHGAPLLQRPFVVLVHLAVLSIGHATLQRLNHVCCFFSNHGVRDTSQQHLKPSLTMTHF